MPAFLFPTPKLAQIPGPEEFMSCYDEKAKKKELAKYQCKDNIRNQGEKSSIFYKEMHKNTVQKKVVTKYFA